MQYKKVVCMCLVEQEKAFDREPKKVLEWTTRKKRIPKGLLRSVMSLYERAKTRVRVDSELSEEFEVKVGMHQLSILSHFLLAMAADIVSEMARAGVISELLYAGDLA